MITDRDIASALTELAAALRQRPAARDWIDAHHAGDVLSSDEAGFVFGCSADTIIRRAEEAAQDGRPLGIKHAGVWMFDLPRLLELIELKHGRHARLAAESRAKKNADLRSPPQNEPISTTVAAVAAS